MATAPPIRVLLTLETMADHNLLVVNEKGGVKASRPAYFNRRPISGNPHPSRESSFPEIAPQTMDGLFSRKCLKPIDVAQICKDLGLKAGTTPRPDDKESWALRPPFPWYETPYEISEEGRALLEQHRDAIADWRQTQTEKPDEFVAILPGGRNAKGVGAWCKVLKRTEKRVYVEVLERTGVPDATSRIEGQTERYVTVEDLFPARIDHATYRKLAAATREWANSREIAETQLASEMAALRSRYRQREEQAHAQFDDEIAEILGEETPKP